MPSKLTPEAASQSAHMMMPDSPRSKPAPSRPEEEKPADLERPDSDEPGPEPGAPGGPPPKDKAGRSRPANRPSKE